jgi:hypothetical protein
LMSTSCRLILLKNWKFTLPIESVEFILFEIWSVIRLTNIVCTTGILNIKARSVGRAMMIPINMIKYFNDFLILLTMPKGLKNPG